MFGGTWVTWGSGKVPVGIDTTDTDFNKIEKTGGNKTHSHIYKIEQIKTKLTLASVKATNLTNTSEPTGSLVEEQTNIPINTNNKLGDGIAWNYNDGIKYSSAGKVQTSSNIMPYITCYMWKRIK